jgi:hypothetical protein
MPAASGNRASGKRSEVQKVKMKGQQKLALRGYDVVKTHVEAAACGRPRHRTCGDGRLRPSTPARSAAAPVEERRLSTVEERRFSTVEERRFSAA